MEFEQIVKRLDWLDAEQRKTKAAISDYEDKFASLSVSITAVQKQAKELEQSIAEVKASAARINQFNDLLAKQREDFNRLFEESEQKHQERHAELVKRHSEEIRPFRGELDELRKGFDLSPLKRELKAHNSEQARLSEAINQ